MYLAVGSDLLVSNEHLWIDIVQKPLEARAVEAFAQLDSLADVAVVQEPQVVPMPVKQAFVVVQPDLG